MKRQVSLLTIYKFLDETGTKVDNSYCEEGYINSWSIDSMCIHGGYRIRNEMLPAFQTHLQDAYNQLNNPQFGEFDEVIRPMKTTDLREFLMAKNDTLFLNMKPQPAKDVHRLHIIETYSHEDLAEWIIEASNAYT